LVFHFGDKSSASSQSKRRRHEASSINHRFSPFSMMERLQSQRGKREDKKLFHTVCLQLGLRG